jgi:NADPH:quinone reductase-like Zn-dependent oxidoreductase
MRRIVIHRAGSYDQLALEDHPDPTPAPGEVLIAVEAIGVNYADVIIRWGLYASAKEFVGWPITPGFEVSGTVAAVGSEVKGWTPGDEVIAVTRFGGYASHLAVPQHQVFARPVGFSSDEAAGFPAVFLTAHYALFFLAHPRPGDTLLIHSAAGGVGGALLQLARIAGCRSLAVVGAAHKVDAAKKARSHNRDRQEQRVALGRRPLARARRLRGRARRKRGRDPARKLRPPRLPRKARDLWLSLDVPQEPRGGRSGPNWRWTSSRHRGSVRCSCAPTTRASSRPI